MSKAYRVDPEAVATMTTLWERGYYRYDYDAPIRRLVRPTVTLTQFDQSEFESVEEELESIARRGYLDVAINAKSPHSTTEIIRAAHIPGSRWGMKRYVTSHIAEVDMLIVSQFVARALCASAVTNDDMREFRVNQAIDYAEKMRRSPTGIIDSMAYVGYREVLDRSILKLLLTDESAWSQQWFHRWMNAPELAYDSLFQSMLMAEHGMLWVDYLSDSAESPESIGDLHRELSYSRMEIKQWSDEFVSFFNGLVIFYASSGRPGCGQ